MAPWLARLPLILTLALVLSPAPITAQSTDCASYDSQIWAQSVYESDPTRYAALDPDGNGLACEELQPGAAPTWWTDEIPAGAEPATLASVTDGDTIRVTMGGIEEPVRLILIDTPETNDPNNPPECYGQEATAYLEWLLSLGGELYLESDVSDRDRFDRLLRYAWLDFGDGEVYLVNEVMARSGYAAESTFPPDVKYEEEIREAARFAREHGYGLWAGCITDEEGDTNELTGMEEVAAPEVQPGPVDPAPVETAPEAVPEQVIIDDPVEAFDCDASYPDLCISPGSADLDCDYVYGLGMSHITVYPPDPHGFDGNDNDGVGCEGG
jgi:micrococcal nuclease